MKKVVKITEEQALLIKGKEFAKDSYFNPQQDSDNNWFTSIETVEQCENKEFDFLKECELIEYKPKITPINL